jgi:hypothetical protein
MTAQHAPQTVLDLISQLVDAERQSSADQLDDLLAPNFTLVGPLGFVVPKDQWLEQYRNGFLKYTALDIQQPQAREYGQAAIVIGTQVQQATYQGNDASGQFRITLIAVHQADRWRLAGMHLSAVAQPRG